VLGGDERSLRVRRLKGGISSAVHAVEIMDAAGELQRYVVRRWTAEVVTTGDGADGTAQVRREAGVLTGLAESELPAPRLVAADAEASSCSYPTLVMTWLPGKVMLRPADPDGWLRQQADLLPRIHAADVPAPDVDLWLDLDALEIPDWSTDDGLWRAALDLVQRPAPGGQRCFIHRDYQPFNLLWTGATLSSVVDWVWSSYGPPDIDVAHCRLNLTVLYSSDRAARFLERYEAVAGRRVEPWWDVAGLLVYLPGWGSFLQQQAGSHLTVDYAGMHERMETTLRAALNRA
jgi:aminoglycoside phosphotransferase (APT) family kinase protein